MIDRIGRGEASGILCWKLDRLARNFIDGGQVIEMIQRGVVQHIRSFERSYYPEDNVLVMAVELGMANQFSRDLAVNVKRGLRAKAQMGWYRCSCAQCRDAGRAAAVRPSPVIIVSRRASSPFPIRLLLSQMR